MSGVRCMLVFFYRVVRSSAVPHCVGVLPVWNVTAFFIYNTLMRILGANMELTSNINWASWKDKAWRQGALPVTP